MRIILDMDQILALFVERILEWYNADHGTNFVRDDIKDWEMTKFLGPQGESFLRSCMRYPEFYRDLDPVDGAIDGVKSLIEKGHDVIIATAIPSCAGIAYHGKLEWIRRNMPFFDLKNMIAVKRKELIYGDMILDDGPHNIEAFRKTGRIAVVFDCPWNRDVRGTYRVENWNGFLELVDKLVQMEKILNGPKAAS